MTKEAISIKAKVKEPYHNSAGVRLPRVTTICGLLDKSKFLVPWAYKCGLGKIDYAKLRDDLADVGTLAHEYVVSMLRGLRDGTIYEVDVYEYTPFQIERAKRSFDSGLAWIQKHSIDPLFTELKVISEIHQFGGRLDLLGPVDGVFTLLDFKTGKWAFDNYFLQLAGYDIALEEHEDFLKLDQRIEQFMIVNIPRAPGDQFQVQVRRNLDLRREEFLHFRAIYKIEKRLARKKNF